MQWQIIHLEVAIAEQEEKLNDARRDQNLQAREVVRMYNMCADLRFELENVTNERDEAKKKPEQKMSEQGRWKEWQKMPQRLGKSRNYGRREQKNVSKKLKRRWSRRCEQLVSHSVCYHQPRCGHLANSAATKMLKPCAHCVPDAIGAALEYESFPTD